MNRKLGVFFTILALCTASKYAKAQGLPAGPQQFRPNSPDFAKLEAEATGWLQGLIRINTSNPPGNELAAANYLLGILKSEGIPAEVDQSVPGRGILMARLSAGPVPDPSRALLLLGHLDVVPADKTKWQVDPFSATIQNGYLCGRGAIDDKAMVIANLAALVGLKRANVRLDRDVILLAEGDEERGGAAGMKFAVTNYWQKIAAGFSLNEGGRVMLNGGKVQYIAVQAAEKVPVNVTVIATGTSGHASVPVAENNAIVHLSRALEKIAAFQAPFELNPVTETYFEQLADVSDPEIGKWMHALDSSVRGDLAKEKIAEANPVWNAMMRNTITPTMLEAGIAPNVAPAEARATLNIRLLPGDSIDALLLKLKDAVNDPQIRFEADTTIGEAAPSSPLNGALLSTIQKTAQEEFPGAPVFPMMSTGATDSAYLRLRNVQAYGLLPFPLTKDDLARMHGNDERIPLASFDKGVEFLYRIVDDFAAAK